MSSHFLWNAYLTIIGLSFLAAPLGCFMLWKRMAFFGDALGHASVLGVAIGLLFNLNPLIGVLLLSIVVAHFLSLGQKTPSDTRLALISYGSLAAGMVLLSLMPQVHIEPESILFGDILSLDSLDVLLTYSIALLLVAFLKFFWPAILACIVDEDYALAQNIPVNRFRLALTLLMALTVSIGLKTVGALLLPALMIIPAAASAKFSPSPEKMVVQSFVIALLMGIGGMFASTIADIPTGPAIVCTGIFIYCVMTSIGSKVIKRFLQKDFF